MFACNVVVGHSIELVMTLWKIILVTLTAVLVVTGQQK